MNNTAEIPKILRTDDRSINTKTLYEDSGNMDMESTETESAYMGSDAACNLFRTSITDIASWGREDPLNEMQLNNLAHLYADSDPSTREKICAMLKREKYLSEAMILKNGNGDFLMIDESKRSVEILVNKAQMITRQIEAITSSMNDDRAKGIPQKDETLCIILEQLVDELCVLWQKAKWLLSRIKEGNEKEQSDQSENGKEIMNNGRGDSD